MTRPAMFQFELRVLMSFETELELVTQTQSSSQSIKISINGKEINSHKWVFVRMEYKMWEGFTLKQTIPPGCDLSILTKKNGFLCFPNRPVTISNLDYLQTRKWSKSVPVIETLTETPTIRRGKLSTASCPPTNTSRFTPRPAGFQPTRWVHHIFCSGR